MVAHSKLGLTAFILGAVLTVVSPRASVAFDLEKSEAWQPYSLCMAGYLQNFLTEVAKATTENARLVFDEKRVVSLAKSTCLSFRKVARAHYGSQQSGARDFERDEVALSAALTQVLRNAKQ